MSEQLPALKAKDLIRIIQREGFVLAHQKGSHATYKHPVTQKRVTIPVHPGRAQAGASEGHFERSKLDPGRVLEETLEENLL